MAAGFAEVINFILILFNPDFLDLIFPTIFLEKKICENV